MTAQIAEILHYDGERLALCNTPLDLYLANNEILFQSRIAPTTCWRGYVGEWTLEDKKLYLLAIYDPDEQEKIEVSELFMGNPKRVFAHWVTGRLRCQQGDLIKYFHGGFGGVYQYDLFFEMKCGVLQSSFMVDNSLSSQIVEHP